MNPEIRFRVPENVYRLAEHRAEELLHGDYSARSTAVSTLARQAFYARLGLDEHRLDSADPAQVELEIYYRVSDEFRRQILLQEGRPCPRVVQHTLKLAPQDVPEEVRPWLQLSPDGRARATFHWEESLELEGTPPSLEDMVARLRGFDIWQDGPAGLRGWVDEHGSELLRLRAEEGFAWLELARQERAVQVLAQAGLAPVVAVREESGLGPGQEPSHALVADREPSLERIKQLRRLRDVAPAGVEVQLVLARAWGAPAASAREAVALRWRLPDGVRLSFLLGEAGAPTRKSPRSRPAMTDLAPGGQ